MEGPTLKSPQASWFAQKVHKLCVKVYGFRDDRKFNEYGYHIQGIATVPTMVARTIVKVNHSITLNYATTVIPQSTCSRMTPLAAVCLHTPLS